MTRRGGAAVRLCLAFGLVASLGPTSRARAALPSFLGSGFPLETLDPAPAGGNFFVTPEVLPKDTVSVRLLLDYAWMPLQLKDGGGKNVISYSGGAYAHLGISTHWSDWLFLSLDVPLVLSQSVDLESSAVGFSAPGVGASPAIVRAPQAGDLGDIRGGIRFEVPGRKLRTSDCLHLGIAGLDVWAPTGDADTLMGDSSFRLRTYGLISGEVALRRPSCPTYGMSPGRTGVFYALAVGYQFLGSSGDLSSSPGLSVRGGLGLRLPLVRTWQVRPSVEYEGMPVTANGDPSRATNELFASAFVEHRSGWSFGPSVSTAELASAPGSPPFRVSLLVQYRGQYQVERRAVAVTE